jgi:hypothetical protein
VTDFLNGGSWELMAEFVEIESGKADDRPQLEQALATCELSGATLVVAKLDRLSRNLAFLAKLQESVARLPRSMESGVTVRETIGGGTGVGAGVATGGGGVGAGVGVGAGGGGAAGLVPPKRKETPAVTIQLNSVLPKVTGCRASSRTGARQDRRTA